ncbi:hypothetical protein EVAR_37175_1 [Eumeta japonica]|uniref:Uncharacterized protein n=1 Tax=Eumeta variegata TaxID=151549 RepID=A0A4C1WLK1_EUMVA|nr:hypothetical protein EVAR_37175_1 [Eumeta japonica]
MTPVPGAISPDWICSVSSAAPPSERKRKILRDRYSSFEFVSASRFDRAKTRDIIIVTGCACARGDTGRAEWALLGPILLAGRPPPPAAHAASSRGNCLLLTYAGFIAIDTTSKRTFKELLGLQPSPAEEFPAPHISLHVTSKNYDSTKTFIGNTSPSSKYFYAVKRIGLLMLDPSVSKISRFCSRVDLTEKRSNPGDAPGTDNLTEQAIRGHRRRAQIIAKDEQVSCTTLRDLSIKLLHEMNSDVTAGREARYRRHQSLGRRTRGAPNARI